MVNKKKINLKTYYKDYTNFKVGDYVVWYYDENNDNRRDFNFERVVKLTENDRDIIEGQFETRPIFTEVLYTQCKFTRLYERGWVDQKSMRLATPTEIALYGQK